MTFCILTFEQESIKTNFTPDYLITVGVEKALVVSLRSVYLRSQTQMGVTVCPRSPSSP